MLKKLPEFNSAMEFDDNGSPPDDVFVFPASFAQQRLWFMDQIEPGQSFYNIPCAVRMRGTLDASALAQSIQEVVNRHEALRTTFGSKNGVPFQIVASYLNLPVPMTDLGTLPDDDKRREIERRVTEETQKPFDLRNGPLIRALLLRFADDEHIAVLTMHHIISDGWSMGVFVREMSELYAAISSGRKPQLPELTIQYADYAHWQRQWLSGEVLQRQLNYWKAQLSGELSALEIPSDRPRPVVPSFRGGSCSLVYPQALCEALKTLGLKENATLFMTLLAAFNALLHRFTGQTDICVGSPIANRNRAEIEGLIGFFVNTLVFRVDFRGEPTFRELLHLVRRTTLEGYEHQDLPFEMVVEAVQPERSASYNPLFQVMFILQNAGVKSQDLPGLNISMMEAETGSSTFDMTLSMTETADGLHAAIEYSTDLFDEATIGRLLENFGSLLSGIVADPGAAVAKLPLISRSERHRLLIDWNDTAKEFPRAQKTFPEIFSEQVDSRPESPAVVVPAFDGSPRRQVSYRELNACADRLAHGLKQRGVGQGRVVGICLDSSVELIAAVLGVMKAGGAYLALDPQHPGKRHAMLLKDSDASLVLSSPRLQNGGWEDFEGRTLFVDGFWSGNSGKSDNSVHASLENHLAYVVYTSGSTGQPKGVMIRQHSLVNAFFAWREAYGLSSEDVHLQMANCAFDVFSGDLVRALGTGGRLVMCPRDFLLAPHRLYEVMLNEGVTCAEFVPAVLRALADYLREAGLSLNFLRMLVCGSDVWYAREYADFRSLLSPQGRLVNSFGLAEATIDSCYFESRSLAPADERLVPIGRPFANNRLYVLDRFLEPVPVGVPGELFVGGSGVADGYVNLPEMTATRFLPDPFSAQEGCRLYKTGDLARFLPKGDIEFLGRLDRQIKVRGMRVEAGEVESVLKQAPGVRDAVIASVALKSRHSADNQGAERLAAYLVTDSAVERIPIEARCTVRPSVVEDKDLRHHGAFELLTSDLSFDGVCLSNVPDFWQQGLSLELSIELPAIYETIQVCGSIAWTANGSAGISIAPSPIQRVLLRRTMDHLLDSDDLSRITDDVDLRIPMQGTCFLETGDTLQHDGQVESISRGTIRLRAEDVDWEKGCKLRIGLQLPGHPDPVWVDGSVLWNRGGRVGVSIAATPEQQQAIDRHVKEFIQARRFSIESVNAFLKSKLPSYMVPSAYVLLDRLPLSANGKVDRRALPAPDEGSLVRSEGYVAARSPVEEVLVGIWSEVLGVERVGVLDDFFELGGHSLLATQVISRVRGAFGLEVPLRSLFETPTVSGLAGQVQRLLQRQPGAESPPIVRVLREGELPLSFAQQRLWFLDQLEPGSGFYNIPEAVRIRGRLEAKVLERCLNEVIRRHEVLRTGFETLDGRAVQVVQPELTVSLEEVDLRHLGPAERERQWRGRVQAAAQAPFDLRRPPLLRGEVLRLSEEEQILVLVMHHIVCDAWSSGVLVQELAGLYEAFSQGRPSPFEELAVQYADYANWQRAWLQGEVLEGQLGYWRQKLAGLPPLLELPGDRGRPAVQSYAGAYVSFELSAELSGGIERFCRAQGVTAFMVLLAAFKVLLYRYTGQRDICVGTPIANRTRQEIEPLVGFFVNTLALRTELSGEPGFAEAVKRVRETALGAYAHQEVPFEMVVDALQPQRSLSHSPLFQVMFALQNNERRKLEVGGLELSQLEVKASNSLFDLTLIMYALDGKLQGAFEYSTDLFDASTIERVATHFRTLLESGIHDPEQPVTGLPMLSEAESRRLVSEWNDTEMPPVQSGCLHQPFEARALREPNAVAVSFEGGSLTYGELDRRANQLANYLARIGVGPETRVGLCLNRSVELLVGLLGILKAGGAYVPLDPAYPADRLSYIIKDSGLSHVVTERRLAERLPVSQMKFVHLDADWPLIAEQKDETPASGVAPRNAAYVIYTSGSTGQPKGVVVEHQSVLNHNLAVAEKFGLHAGDRVLQFATINFDASVEELFPTWMQGASVVLRPDEILPDGDDLLKLIEDKKVTVIDLPTAYWQEWVRALSVSSKPIPDCLRLAVLGGDKCQSECLAEWQKFSPAGAGWMNTYGPTEGTIVATLFEPFSGDRQWAADRSVPIGWPIGNNRIYILDERMQPVPVGVSGEIYIGGQGVVRGYLGQPTLTAARFVPDPFSPSSGGRLYRTGDLGRYRPNGAIEFLGRADHQLKLRGFRVEPGEIESVLRQHPAVGEAVVVALKTPERGPRLVAYLTGRAAKPDSAELHGFLKSKLPEYMIPAAYVVLEGMPMLPSGKVDRRSLPAPDESSLARRQEFVEAQTENERVLVGIWRQLLGVEKVGVHDNFFELGGDSILSIQVVARARQAGLQLSPRQLFEHPTVSALALEAGALKAVSAEQGEVAGPVPLTPIQRWFFEQGFSEPSHWNQSVLLKVNARLEEQWLRPAVGHVLQQHDALRLRFRRTEGAWEQENAGAGGEVPLEWVDLSGLSVFEQVQALERQSAEWQRSLELGGGPLMRVVYFDLGAGGGGRLLVVAHHLVVDGVSWRILLEDLQEAYGRLSRGAGLRPEVKTSSFKQWSQRLSAYAQSDEVIGERGYWQSVGRPGLGRIPVDYAGGRNTEATAAGVSVELSAERTRQLLQEVPSAYGTEINDVLLTALAQALWKWTDSRAVLVEVEGHGREDLFEEVDLTRTVGWFTTVYPVRLEAAGRGGPGQELKSVKEQLRGVPRRGIGYGLLRYLSMEEGLREEMSGLPRSQVAFNYLGQFDQQLGGEGLFGEAPEQRGAERSGGGERSHLLEINGAVAGGRLRVEWTYSAEVHRVGSVRQAAGDFLSALEELIDHCLAPEAGGYTPSDFPLAGITQENLDKVMTKLG